MSTITIPAHATSGSDVRGIITAVLGFLRSQFRPLPKAPSAAEADVWTAGARGL